MTRQRRDGLFLMLLGCVAFLGIGGAMERVAPMSGNDFRLIYTSNRCLLDSADPYQETRFRQAYLGYGGGLPEAAQMPAFADAMRYQYLPTTVLLFPLALLPFEAAHTIWVGLISIAFLTGAFSIWNLAAKRAPVLSGGLVGLILATSGLLLVHCNVAGIVVGLCCVAVWCFLEERFVALGMVCLAFGLMMKPQDVALVWLYFLLAGGVYRRRACQTLLVAAILGLPAILWVTHIAPHWPTELHASLSLLVQRGHGNDPGPASMSTHGVGMILSLQSILSLLWDEPLFYNLLAYLVCGSLLMLWARITLRSRRTERGTWIALAVASALTMLPVYHRLYDSRLLLLAIPGCALLYREGGRISKFAPEITGLGILITADLPWIVVIRFLKGALTATASQSRLVVAAEVIPVPLVLLLIAVVYLWAYASRKVPEQEKNSFGANP